MKKIFSTVFLAALAIIICCLCLFYVVAVSDKAKDSVEKIQLNVINMQYKAAREETENLNKFLESNHTMLSAILHHNILEEIEESIALLKTSLENISDEEQANFWLESMRSLSRIKNLRDTEIPSIGNIL